MYYNLILHPYSSIVILKFDQIFGFKALNKLILFMIIEILNFEL